MINKITKRVVKEVNETVSEEFICDICGKKGTYDKWAFDQEATLYYHIETGHNDWGHDSCESIQHKQACCTACLLKVFSDWLNDEDTDHSYTAYIEINKDRHMRKIQENPKND